MLICVFDELPCRKMPWTKFVSGHFSALNLSAELDLWTLPRALVINIFEQDM